MLSERHGRLDCGRMGPKSRCDGLMNKVACESGQDLRATNQNVRALTIGAGHWLKLMGQGGAEELVGGNSGKMGKRGGGRREDGGVKTENNSYDTIILYKRLGAHKRFYGAKPPTNRYLGT